MLDDSGTEHAGHEDSVALIKLFLLPVFGFGRLWNIAETNKRQGKDRVVDYGESTLLVAVPVDKEGGKCPAKVTQEDKCPPQH